MVMKIGFIVWNPFQVVQFENTIRVFVGAVLIIIDNGDNLHLFNKSWLRLLGMKIEYVRRGNLPYIDDVYDAIFFQSPFPSMEKLLKTRLISLQYGLAKERHNYGEWRSLADMNLMYGRYSVNRVKHFSPSYAVGNPKFDKWEQINTQKKRQSSIEKFGLDKNKNTILYMPTWGDLGSFPELKKKLASLIGVYNIIVKMHHNNDSRYPEWKADAIGLGLKWIFDGGADQLELLSVADVVVSDFSGAIFDATFARVPVLLFQTDVENKGGIQKFEVSSLEFFRRDEIGIVCVDLSTFEDLLKETINRSSLMIKTVEPLRSELYIKLDKLETSCMRIRTQVEKLIRGEIPPLTQSQRYVRETVQALRIANQSLKLTQRKLDKKSWFSFSK
jgi:hypothetical protein